MKTASVRTPVNTTNEGNEGHEEIYRHIYGRYRTTDFFYRIESFQPEREHGDTQIVANVVFFILCMFCLCYIIWLIFVILDRLGLFKINNFLNDDEVLQT